MSVVSVDAGHLTTSVRQQCARRRWWLPVVGRAGRGARDKVLPVQPAAYGLVEFKVSS